MPQPQPEARSLAIYARVSTADQDAEVQLHELRRYAERRGLPAVEYVDGGVSGRRRSRPALDRLTAACRRREHAAVVVVALDRVARSLAHLAQLVEELAALDVEVVSLRESIDSSTAMGRAMLNVAGTFAQLEADLIRERTVAGLRAARRRGARLGRPRALDRRGVARARRLLASGVSVREVARRLGVAHPTILRALGRA